MNNVYIKTTMEFGRGLYAALDIPKGKILAEEELLVLNPLDTVLVNSTDLQYYTFKYSEKQDCLVLGLGEIFNHSNNPNVGYKLVDGEGVFEGRKLMQFFTLKEIQKDEQLLIDYSADVKVETNKYTVNLI